MAKWRLLDAKRRGTLVARVLSRAWCSTPPALDLSPDDLALVASLMIESPAAALAWNKLRNAPLEQRLRDQLRDVYRFLTLRSELRTVELEGVLSKLRAAGIEPIVHKGWASARLYPNPEMRSYSDIDLLIRPDQLGTARAALQTPPPVSCPIDLAHSEISELDSLSWDDLYEHSRLVKLGADEVRILKPEHHLRSLCIHCLKHGVANPLWLVDVAVAIEAISDEFDWEICIGKRQPQSNWVRTALSLAHRLLDADIRGTPIADFVNELPGWFAGSVLRRWSRAPVPGPLPRLAAVLRRGTGLMEAFAWRWPSAGQTTVDANARFTRVPKIHLQLRSLFAPAKVKLFVGELPMVWRSGTENSQD